MQQPTLQTARLTLRPFALIDAPAVQRLLQARVIAEMTSNIPHLYEEGMAEAWIQRNLSHEDGNEVSPFAITLRQDGNISGTLCGAMGLSIDSAHQHAELGYWIGGPFWGKGYATEAATELLRYAFTDLGLNRVHASHYAKNPASGRVMQKIGMR